MRALRGTALALLTALLVACGGGNNSLAVGGGGSSGGNGGSSGGGSSSGGQGNGNVQPVGVNLGPTGHYINGIFTSVTVCIPGSNSCQTINDVLVDTGSYGLRILGTALNLALPAQTGNGGTTIGECSLFADGFTWGPVATADVRIAGEVASAVPVAVFGSAGNFPGFPSPPAACRSSGHNNEEDTLSTFGANGVLGVGAFQYDCGGNCVSNSGSGIYYACSGNQCNGTTQTEPRQVQNPVALFSGDNNGVIIQLPSVGSGAATASGNLVFGIGTQSNNGLGSAQILAINNNGNFSTSFNGNSSITAFIDSGSNALFFDDNAIPQCGSPDTGFYCPNSTLNLSAVMIGANNVSVTVPFSVGNAANLASSGNAAIPTLAGAGAGTGVGGEFDWGLPFFYGRNVYFAIYGFNTPGGTGPYYAF